MPVRAEHVTILAPLAKRMRPRLPHAVRLTKPSIPVEPVSTTPQRAVRQFHPPAQVRVNAAPAVLMQPILAIPDAVAVPSQSPLSSQPVAVALPAPKLKVDGIGDIEAAAATKALPATNASARATGAFGDASVAQHATRSAGPLPAAEPRPAQFFPVEILSKPRPIYTEEARNLHVQGEVLLEVMFRAAGDVRILRTVRSLGHGLDEAAQDAARQIRFRPARSGESAIDAIAVVHIAFELAY
jgi:TonB family protein